MRSEWLPPLFVERADGRHDGGSDRQIGAGALLGVAQTDLDGIAVEARDGAARVKPFMLQNALRVMRGNIAIHRREHIALVVRSSAAVVGND